MKDSLILVNMKNGNDLSEFLINEGQNKIGLALTEIISHFNNIISIEDIAYLWDYIRKNFSKDENNSVEKFFRTSEEIAESKIWSGCSDLGTLIAPILRELAVPTIYLQCASLDWIEELVNNGAKKNMVIGHIFLEIYLDKKWILFDSTNGEVYTDYDYSNYSLPKNYYVFSKSLNGHQVGCINLQENNRIMKKTFNNFDINKYNEPNYSKIDLRVFLKKVE